jgi:hypothetical protein
MPLFIARKSPKSAKSGVYWRGRSIGNFSAGEVLQMHENGISPSDGPTSNPVYHVSNKIEKEIPFSRYFVKSRMVCLAMS